MPILSEQESQTVAWFRELEKESTGRVESVEMDALGYIAIALRPDPSPEDAAWLKFASAQAAGKGAIVNFDEHGCLVLVLPRYAKAEQRTLELPDSAATRGKKGRRVRQGQEQGTIL